MTHFLPLELLEADTEMTHRSDQPGTGYDVYIRLSDMAPQEWKAYFEDKWRSEMDSNHKRARVAGGYVVLENCPIPAAGNFKPKLLAAVEYANQMYARFAAKSEQQRHADELHEAAEQEHINSLKERLKFN